MKKIRYAHLPHHHNGFVATCRLWTASRGVHADYPVHGSKTNNVGSPPMAAVYSQHVATKPLS